MVMCDAACRTAFQLWKPGNGWVRNSEYGVRKAEVQVRSNWVWIQISRPQIMTKNFCQKIMSYFTCRVMLQLSCRGGGGGGGGTLSWWFYYLNYFGTPSFPLDIWIWYWNLLCPRLLSYCRSCQARVSMLIKDTRPIPFATSLNLLSMCWKCCLCISLVIHLTQNKWSLKLLNCQCTIYLTSLKLLEALFMALVFIKYSNCNLLLIVTLFFDVDVWTSNANLQLGHPDMEGGTCRKTPPIISTPYMATFPPVGSCIRKVGISFCHFFLLFLPYTAV